MEGEISREGKEERERNREEGWQRHCDFLSYLIGPPGFGASPPRAAAEL